MAKTKTAQTWMTADQLAARLQVPKATLYRWRYVNYGPAAVRIGKHLRYALADVEAFEANLLEQGQEAARRGA